MRSGVAIVSAGFVDSIVNDGGLCRRWGTYLRRFFGNISIVGVGVTSL